MTAPEREGKTLEAILAEVPADRCLRIEVVRIWHPPNRVGLVLSHVDPGAPRRVPQRLCPLLVGDEGEIAADLLEKVAGALRRATGGRCGHVRRWPGAISTECVRPAGHDGLHRVHGWAWPQEING